MKKSWVIIVLFSFCACYDQVEGCLDPEATNFNPEADDSCCCMYPELLLDVLYTYDSLEFFERNRYAHAVHDSIVVLDFGIIMKNFQLRSASQDYSITDSTEFWIADGMDSSRQFRSDDLILFGDRFNYVVGQLIPALTFESLSFTTGVGSELNDVLPNTLTSHPLATLSQKGHWTEGQGFSDAFIHVAIGEDLQDTIYWTSGVNGFEAGMSLSGQFDKAIGSDLTIAMELDMKCLINDVDFLADPNVVTTELLNRFEHETCIKIR